MFGRLVGLFGLVAAFVLTAQLRGSYLVDPNPWTTAAMAVFIAGVALLAAVVSGGILSKRRKYWQPPAPDENQRQTFRIVYPEGDQPRLVVGQPWGDSATFQVLDVSEEGLRFADDASLMVGHEVRGQLVFADGSSAQVSGKVVRRMEDQVCLHLTHTVPSSLIVGEQLRLRKRARSANG
jgi:hypothetical protein